METAIYEAALKGDRKQLFGLVQQNADILNRATAAGLKQESPLHIAAQFGHVEFVKEILYRRPEYVRDLNSQGQSPLHLASDRGHLDVVEVLLKKDKEICFFRDKDGRTPLQLAALKGRLEVMKKLVREKPAAAWMLTKEGEPILHLSAKYNQFAAVKKLVELVNDIQFLNMKDSEGNTILHILAAEKQNQVIRHLVGKRLVDVNTKNVYGSTAFDVLLENTNGLDSWWTKLLLIRARAEIKRKWLSARPDNTKPKMVTENCNNLFNEGLLVLAILMATVAFQAGINPPGGVWQDSGLHNTTLRGENGEISILQNVTSHLAGESVFFYTHQFDYLLFCFYNSITLVLSLILIGLLVIGFNFDKWWSKLILITITFGSVYTMLRAYQKAMVVLSSPFVLTNYLMGGIEYNDWKASAAMAFQVILISIFSIFSLQVIPINFWYCFLQCASLCVKFKEKLSYRVGLMIRGPRAEPIPRL